jgi:hypothetical protein
MNGDEDKKNDKNNIDKPASPPKDTNKLEKPVNDIKKQPSETQEIYEPEEERVFNSIREDNRYKTTYGGLLVKKQQSIERSLVEESKLKQRLETVQDFIDKKHQQFSTAAAKVYGYNIDDPLERAQLSVDLPKLASGEIQAKQHLFKTQEEYEHEKQWLPERLSILNRGLMKKGLIERSLAKVEERKEMLAEKGLASSVARELSTTETKTNILSREPETAVRGALEVEGRKFFNYPEKRKLAQEELERVKQEVFEASQETSTPEGREKFLEATNKLESKTRESAKAIALERAQKRGGFDRESQYERASSLVQDIESKKSSKEIQEKMKAGGEEGFRSLEDALKKLDKTSETLAEKFKAFNEEMETAKGVTEETAKALAEATEEQQRQQKVVKEFEKQGDSGGPKWAKGLQEASNVGLAVSDAARYSFITSDIQQKQARAGVADIVNQEYFDYRAAAKGDMSALRRVSGMYRRQEKEAAELKLREVGVGSGEVGLASAGVLGEVAEAQATAVLPWDKVIKGGTAAVKGGAKVAKIGVDVGKEITSTNTFIQGFQAGKGLEDTTNAIADYHRQELFDYGRNMYSTVQGFGAESDKTFKAFSTGESLSKFAELGFNPTETLQLVGQASQAMGGAFTNVSAGKQQEITRRAAELDQARVMSAEQYMGNMGQLTQVGGGQKQMEEIMSNAVARGVGNAKNISDIVSLVTGMAAKTGSASAAGTTAIVNRTMANLAEVMPGAEYEALRRQTTAALTDKTNEMISGTGMDFASVVGMAHINKDFGHLSQATRMVMKRDLSLDKIAEMEERLKDKSPEGEKAFKEYTQSIGMAEMLYDEEGKYIGADKAREAVGKLKKIAAKQVSTTTVGVADSKTREQYEKHISGEKQELTEAETAKLGAVAKLATGVTGAAEGQKGQFGENTAKSLPKVSGAPKEGPTSTIAGQVAAGKQVDVKGLGTGAALEGKDVIDALGNMTKQFTEAMKDFKPGELQTKSAQAAEKMTTDFSTIVNVDFKNAIKSLREAAELIKGARGIKEFISTNHPEKTTPLPDNKHPQSKQIK